MLCQAQSTIFFEGERTLVEDYFDFWQFDLDARSRRQRWKKCVYESWILAAIRSITVGWMDLVVSFTWKGSAFCRSLVWLASRSLRLVWNVKLGGEWREQKRIPLLNKIGEWNKTKKIDFNKRDGAGGACDGDIITFNPLSLDTVLLMYHKYWIDVKTHQVFKFLTFPGRCSGCLIISL